MRAHAHARAYKSVVSVVGDLLCDKLQSLVRVACAQVTSVPSAQRQNKTFCVKCVRRQGRGEECNAEGTSKLEVHQVLSQSAFSTLSVVASCGNAKRLHLQVEDVCFHDI